MILVDSCVWIDVLEGDPQWRSWSAEALATASASQDLAINPIIYAEISASFGDERSLESSLGGRVRRLTLPYEAGFLAGKAFQEYRRRGGPRSSLLPDFYIGAHAALTGMKLLTRDPRRFIGYFPKLSLITPE